MLMNVVLIEIEPVLARAGPITIRWYSVLVLLALVVSSALAIRAALRAGVLPTSGSALDLTSWTLLSGVVGARSLHVVEHWQFYATRPTAVFDLSTGGLSSWGGFLTGAMVLALLSKRRGVELSRLADAVAPPLALGDAIAQLGLFLNGDGQGLPSGLPWATHYRSSDAMTPDFGVPRHPVQVYQLISDLLGLALLSLVGRHLLPGGARFWYWAAWYGSSRVAIGLVRLDPRQFLDLQLGQIIGMMVAAVAIAFLIRSTLQARLRTARQ